MSDPAATSDVVVVVGDVMNDVVVRPLGSVHPGSDTDSEIRRSPGGSGANQAAWLARLGVPVRFYGRAGAADAAEHAAALRREGVDVRLGIDDELPTGNIVVLVTSDGERHMFTDRGANLGLCEADLPDEVNGVSHLHVSGYALFDPATRRAVAALIEMATRHAVPVSCDPSSESYLRAMGREPFLAATGGVETIFPNVAEARFLAGDDAVSSDAEVAAALTAFYPTVVVKLGRRGALVATRGAQPVHVGAAETDMVDTTGAGDAFFAGYLAAAVGGAAPADAARTGVETAANAIRHMGGRPEAIGGRARVCHPGG